MSCSKPLPPFAFDLLYYLNRDQLERFSIVCRPLKNFIDRYFHSKPYRVFDDLRIRGGSYILFHKEVQWHLNRGDYTTQQFLAGQKCSIDKNMQHRSWNGPTYYSFAEMRPYLFATVRIKCTIIYVSGSITYHAEQVDKMESIAYLWRGGNIYIRNANNDYDIRTGAEDFQLVLNSPTILQCQTLSIDDARFSFKDYKALYAVKVLRLYHFAEDEIDLWYQYWQQFLEEPGVKPIVGFIYLRHKVINKILDQLSKAFSSAISPNSFKIVFGDIKYDEDPYAWTGSISLTEFREKNSTSGEILELKKGLPAECENLFDNMSFTLERSSI